MLLSKKKPAFINIQDVVINIDDHKVKVTHVPTQTIIESCQNKCPYKNKAEALSTLRKILLEKLAS